MRIDAHHHVWRVARGDYGWLTPDLGPIHRDFGMDDLAPFLARHGIAGTILVQAAPTEAETAFLLETAEAHPAVLGVVGWTDFEAQDAGAAVARLAGSSLLVGLRPMVQDIPDDGWLASPRITPALAATEAQGLVFDALVLPRHLRHLIGVADRHPGLPIVLDHGAKPRIAEGLLDPWRDDLRALARRPNVTCKLSGLVTEAGAGWTVERLRPYVQEILDCFGPGRVLWGSDWPVVDLAGGYDRWAEAADALLAGLPAADRAAILGGNAARIYLAKRGRTPC